MDVSEKYIKMCEGSYKDLKEGYRPNPLFSRRRRMLYVVDGKVKRWDNIVDITTVERAFPLWEQDQLQEIAHIKPKGVFRKCQSLWWFIKDFYGENANEYTIQFDSMEQLWLAFVMEELHNKTWNNDKQEWVKIP